MVSDGTTADPGRPAAEPDVAVAVAEPDVAVAEPVRRSRARRLLAADAVVPVVLSLLFSLLVWRHIVAQPRARSQSSGGEEGIYLWYLAHVPDSVLHHSNPFITHAMNYPAGVNLLWNTSLLTPGLILAPVTQLGGVVLAYNITLILTTALSVLTAYAACRRFVRWWPAALVGGALVAISPYLVGQARGHLNLILVAIPPLFLLVGDELLVRQRMRTTRLGLLLAFLVVLQVGSSTEILASTAAVAVLGVIVLAALNVSRITGERVAYVVRALAVGVAASLVVLALPGYYLFFGPQHLTGQAQASDRFRADLLSPIVPTGVQKLAPTSLVKTSSGFLGNGFENTGYLGVTLLLLVIGTVIVLRRDRTVVWLGIMALVSLILSFGSTLAVDGAGTGFPLPYQVLSQLPLFNSGTAVRYSYYTMLLCALLVSVACDRARAALAAGHRLPAFAVPVAVVAAFIPLIPNVLPFRAVTLSIPAFFTGPGVQTVPEKSVLLPYPYLNRFNSEPMTWQALANFRYLQIGDYAITPDKNGKGIFDVTTATAYVESRMEIGVHIPMGSTPVKAMRGELKKWGVRTIVIDLTSAHAADAVTFYEAFLGQQPIMVGGVAEFANVHA